MLTCKEMCESTSDYLDQQVSFLKRMEMIMHWAICKHCRRYLHQLARAHNFIEPALVEKMPPEELRLKLLQELEHQQLQRMSSLQPRNRD